MKKPKWKTAPVWANYLGQDSDGGGFWWFEKEPISWRGKWILSDENARTKYERAVVEQKLFKRPIKVELS